MLGLLASPLQHARHRALGNKSQSTDNTVDQIYSGMTLADLDRYREELSPLEGIYRDQLVGPQAEANRQKALQTIASNTDNAFGRATARIAERRRRAGISGGVTGDESRRLQIAQQVAKAKNTTDGARYLDRLREDLL